MSKLAASANMALLLLISTRSQVSLEALLEVYNWAHMQRRQHGKEARDVASNSRLWATPEPRHPAGPPARLHSSVGSHLTSFVSTTGVMLHGMLKMCSEMRLWRSFCVCTPANHGPQRV